MSRVVVLDPAPGDFPAAVGLHYQLVCYVCGPSCVKPSPFEGWATFAHIFNNRPNGCRFAVARTVPLRAAIIKKAVIVEVAPEPEGPYLVWDLLDDGLIDRSSRGSALLHPPLPMWTGDAPDGLTMRAMLQYERQIDTH